MRLCGSQRSPRVLCREPQALAPGVPLWPPCVVLGRLGQLALPRSGRMGPKVPAHVTKHPPGWDQSRLCKEQIQALYCDFESVNMIHLQMGQKCDASLGLWGCWSRACGQPPAASVPPAPTRGARAPQGQCPPCPPQDPAPSVLPGEEGGSLWHPTTVSEVWEWCGHHIQLASSIRS